MPRNRGKKTRERRDLATNPLTPDERSNLLQALLKPPLAISSAIIGALIVEHELETSIRGRLRRITDDEWRTILLDEDGPLGTFDRKTKFAKHLGLIDSDMKSNLDVIRTVRNLFAHSKRLLSFDHPLVVSELRKIKIPKGNKKGFTKIGNLNVTWAQYASLCFECSNSLAKKRFAAGSLAHKAWLRRFKQRNPAWGGLLGALGVQNASGTPPKPPQSNPQHHQMKIDGDPKAESHAGYAGGLLALIGQHKDTSDK